MKKYRCHKEVHAKPMHKGDYNAYKGWVIPRGERKDEEGYLVIYNKDTKDHYESWSPKKLFDEGYTEGERFVEQSRALATLRRNSSFHARKHGELFAENAELKKRLKHWEDDRAAQKN